MIGQRVARGAGADSRGRTFPLLGQANESKSPAYESRDGSGRPRLASHSGGIPLAPTSATAAC